MSRQADLPEPPAVSRRGFLQGSGALLGSCLLPPVATAWAASPTLALDFRGSIPPAVTFRRASPASLADSAQLRTLPAHAPRFPLRRGAPLGLLIEGAASNLVANASRPDRPGWTAGGGVIVAASTDLAPDGSPQAFRIVRPEPKSGSLCEASVTSVGSGEFASASVWLRSVAGSGTWRLRLLDFTTFNNVNAVVEVGPEWRRYSLALNLQARDTGAKRFAVLWNEPFAAASAAPAIYALKPATPYLPGRTPLTLNGVLMWGAQLEAGNEASSFIATGGAAGQRAADEVTFPAAPLNAAAGRLTIVLPDGGRRGGVILDAHGDDGGLRLEYSNSGWLVARVGRVALAGYADVTAHPVIRLEWSAAGAQLFAGATPESLVLQAAVHSNPLPLACGVQARLGMLADGRRPLGRVLAQLTLDGEAAPVVARAARPNFVPAPYRLVFGDDFDDPDLGRINENATGGRPGAPAWRSRYRHARQTAINQEKQIYMDPQFAGTAKQPLRVQPFAIRDGILEIRAERAAPAVMPYLWQRAYTSGCITSELTHWQTYGYFEMRARLPRGKGFWPAFWLLPKRPAWPPEIDVFEASGTRPYAIKHGAIERPRSATTAAGMWIDGIIDNSDGFHIYGMEWTRDNIVFFIDGIKSFEYGPHGIHEDMYLLANLALGSHDPNWIPDPDPTTPFPGLYEIDYIRAYQRGAP